MHPNILAGQAIGPTIREGTRGLISSYAHAYSAAARGEHLPARENSQKESVAFCFLFWVRLRLIVRSAREAVLDSLPGLDFARRCSGCMPASSLSSALLGMHASFSLISLLLSGTADLCSRVWLHFWFHFGMVLASFWASGVTWRPPGEPLCPTSAPGSSQARFLAHFGQPLGLLLEPFSETFSAQGPLQSPPAAIFCQFRPHVVTLRF